MPSKKQYDLVSDDGYDSRIPLHNEEAFQHGISFQSKYIGTLDVPRPSSRVEIVAAMRRIRYEFKAKAIKKKKVLITISTEGAKVTLRKKKKKNQWPWDENRLMVMHHAIYRIFYVSHDSQDLKIFSYIARDGTTNVFKCNVFKAYKKSTAMRIVRTIGQAFEVCHKLSMQYAPKAEPEGEENHQEEQERRGSKISPDSNYESEPAGGDDASTNPAEEAFKQAQAMLSQATQGMKSPPPRVPLGVESLIAMVQSTPKPEYKTFTMEAYCHPNIRPETPIENDYDYDTRYEPVGGTISSPLGSPHLVGDIMPTNTTAPLSTHHQMQLLRQQLEQQQQQTQVSIAQVHLLKDQLAAETAARIEAQARTHQLLLQNRELLEHINNLVGRLQDLELKVNGVVPSADMLIKIPPQQEEGATADVVKDGHTTISRVYTNKHRRSKLLPYLEELKEVLQRLRQIPVLPDPTTPQSGPVIMPEYRDIEASNMTAIPEQTMFENSNIKAETTDSPDSGHKEMSSDSLSLSCNNHQDNGNTIRNQDFGPWHRMSNGHEFILDNNNPFSMAPVPRAAETRRDSPRKDRFKVITPIPQQDASGNRLDLTVTPRLDPPPKFKRERSTSRSPKTTGGNVSDTNYRNSYQSTSSQESQGPFYRCKVPVQRSDSHPGDRGEHERIVRNHSNNTTGSTSSSSSGSTSRTINNLSHSSNKSNQFIMPQTDTLKAKLRISFSDDENGNTSTEDNSIAQEQQRRSGSYLDELSASSS
ncbi:capon-like protein isoform X3 [Lineus longissimus]|uniref:capon-like protein isoform X3 n=1 Tax=Lineus longissimus TaxID=88925 RepID=UPI002B4D6AC5